MCSAPTPSPKTSSCGGTPPYKKYKNTRVDSVLTRQKLFFTEFVELIFYLSIKNLSNIAISQLTGISENTISDWKTLLHTRVANWLILNPAPLGGPGVIVEVDEAKFGKRKHNKGRYREGKWVLGGVEWNTRQCFVVRTTREMLLLIRRWVLPGSVVYTDEWAAHNGLTANGYTHNSANHSIQFVDPNTGLHTNTQEGLWAHLFYPCLLNVLPMLPDRENQYRHHP